VVVSAWLLAGVLVWAAVLAAVATRVPALEQPVRTAVTPLVIVVAVFVVADVGLVLRAEPADRPASMLTHVGYAVAAVGLVPLLTTRRPHVGESDDADAEAEPEPVSLWVLAVALLAVAICVVRLVQTR
jgi:hypothetical protein